jgi:ornithine decarboxylase
MQEILESLKISLDLLKTHKINLKQHDLHTCLSSSKNDPFKYSYLTPFVVEDLVKTFGSPLMILDCDKVRTQYRSLNKALGGLVNLHYALKPCPYKEIVTSLMEEGAFFDVASNAEIDIINQEAIDPSRCIHTHPIKTIYDIEYALDNGVTTFVIDNIDELKKFTKFRRYFAPESEKKITLLLRLSFPNPQAQCNLSLKFGCAAANALGLLEKAKELGTPIHGFSFHVGSQSPESIHHVNAVQACIKLISQANSLGLPSLDIVDIGGGFPVPYIDENEFSSKEDADKSAALQIEAFCAPIVEALKKLPSTVRLLAEPGRFIVAPAGTCVATVIGKAKRPDGKMWYYLDDGVYGSYSGKLYDHGVYPINALFADAASGTEISVLAGPTCDSIDVISDNISLPALEIGDLIIGGMMGAYTSASATDFNLIPRAKLVIINTHHYHKNVT